MHTQILEMKMPILFEIREQVETREQVKYDSDERLNHAYQLSATVNKARTPRSNYSNTWSQSLIDYSVFTDDVNQPFLVFKKGHNYQNK